jgi:hypothetical protein
MTYSNTQGITTGMIEYNSFVNEEEELVNGEARFSWEMLLDGDDAVLEGGEIHVESSGNTNDFLIDFDLVELVVSAASEAAFDLQFDLDVLETDSLKLVKRNVPRSTRRLAPSGGEDSPTSSTDVDSFEMEEESYTMPLNFGDEDEANDKNTTTTTTRPRRRKLVPRRPWYYYQESSPTTPRLPKSAIASE